MGRIKTTVKPVSEEQTDVVTRMLMDVARGYAGGASKLQLALGHPELVQRFQACFDKLAYEQEQRARLTRNQNYSKFEVDTAEFQCVDDLCSELDSVRLAYFPKYVRTCLLPGITLCSQRIKVSGYDVYASGHEESSSRYHEKRDPLFRSFYDEKVLDLGYGRPVQEYGALLALKWARQLLLDRDCELEVGERYLILSDPLKVNANGRRYFLHVRRYARGLHLDFVWFDPASQIDLFYPCLAIRT